MLRSVSKIFGTVLAVALVGWLWVVYTTEEWYFYFSDLLLVFVWLIVLGVIVTSLLWALGLTRFSTVHVRQGSIVTLSYLEQAMRMNLPLSRMLIAAQASEPRWIGLRIGRLRKQLDNGSSIADALRKAVPGTSARTVSMIAAAENIGQVGPELTRLVRDAEDRQTNNIADRTFARSYPVIMCIVIFAVVSMMMIFVIPKFEQIFHDFKVQFPPITRAVLNVAFLFDGATWLILLVGLPILLAVGRGVFRRWNWLSPARFFTSHRDLADICHVISRGLEASVPFDNAILGASELAVSWGMRVKLKQWAAGMRAGQLPAEAAKAAGLPKLIATLTTTPEGFEFLSRYYASKFSRLMIFLRASTIPAIGVFLRHHCRDRGVGFVPAAGRHDRQLWTLFELAMKMSTHHHPTSAVRRRAYMAVDMLLGIVIVVGVSVMLMGAVHRERSAETQLAASRGALHLAEHALLNLQHGQSLPITSADQKLTVHPALDGKPPAGFIWAKVDATVGGHTRSLFGVVPVSSLPTSGTKS